MRRYETIVISDPDLSEEQREDFFKKIRDLIDQQGFLAEFDEWGNRKLAYEIRKKLRGYYVRLDYCGNGELVDEIERQFRIDDRAMKYMTIVIDRDADVEKIKKELEEAALALETPAQAEKSGEEKTPEKVSEKAPAEAAPAEAAPAEAAPAEAADNSGSDSSETESEESAETKSGEEV